MPGGVVENVLQVVRPSRRPARLEHLVWRPSRMRACPVTGQHLCHSRAVSNVHMEASITPSGL